MPFINGKYYMNPVYGAAVEAARIREDSAPENTNATAAPEIELVAAQNASQQQQPAKQQPHNPRQEKHFNGDATYYNLPGSKTAADIPSTLMRCPQQ